MRKIEKSIKKSINTQNSNLKSSALNKPSRNHNSILKQNLTNSNTNENNINFQNMNIKRKNSFMSKFNKYKITSKLLRKIIDLKEKIKKMEKMIGNEIKDKKGKMNTK